MKLKKVKMKTREEQTSFLAYIHPHKSFTPSFLLALLAPLTAGSYSSLNQVFVKMRFGKSCELIPSFMKW
jgi:hypothetical protein